MLSYYDGDYRAMHFSAKRGYEIAYCLSLRVWRSGTVIT